MKLTKKTLSLVLALAVFAATLLSVAVVSASATTQ